MTDMYLGLHWNEICFDYVNLLMNLPFKALLEHWRILQNAVIAEGLYGGATTFVSKNFCKV